MKKKIGFIAFLLICSAFFVGISSCLEDEECGSYNGKQLYREESGRCYYIDENCNNVYVADSDCNC